MASRCGRYLRSRSACTGGRTCDWCASFEWSCTSGAECSTNGSPNVRRSYGGCHEQFAGGATGASPQCEDAGEYAMQELGHALWVVSDARRQVIRWLRLTAPSARLVLELLSVFDHASSGQGPRTSA